MKRLRNQLDKAQSILQDPKKLSRLVMAAGIAGVLLFLLMYFCLPHALGWNERADKRERLLLMQALGLKTGDYFPVGAVELNFLARVAPDPIFVENFTPIDTFSGSAAMRDDKFSEAIGLMRYVLDPKAIDLLKKSIGNLPDTLEQNTPEDVVEEIRSSGLLSVETIKRYNDDALKLLGSVDARNCPRWEVLYNQGIIYLWGNQRENAATALTQAETALGKTARKDLIRAFIQYALAHAIRQTQTKTAATKIFTALANTHTTQSVPTEFVLAIKTDTLALLVQSCRLVEDSDKLFWADLAPVSVRDKHRAYLAPFLEGNNFWADLAPVSEGEKGKAYLASVFKGIYEGDFPKNAPEDSLAAYNLALALCQLGRMDEALRVLSSPAEKKTRFHVPASIGTNSGDLVNIVKLLLGYSLAGGRTTNGGVVRVSDNTSKTREIYNTLYCAEEVNDGEGTGQACAAFPALAGLGRANILYDEAGQAAATNNTEGPGQTVVTADEVDAWLFISRWKPRLMRGELTETAQELKKALARLDNNPNATNILESWWEQACTIITQRAVRQYWALISKGDTKSRNNAKILAELILDHSEFDDALHKLARSKPGIPSRPLLRQTYVVIAVCVVMLFLLYMATGAYARTFTGYYSASSQTHSKKAAKSHDASPLQGNDE